MSRAARVLILGALLALKPACGGSGGGGGSTGTGASMPALPPLVINAPAAGSLPSSVAALTPDLSGTVHEVDTTALPNDAAIASAIQGFMNGGGRITFKTGGGPRTIVLSAPLHLDFGSPAVILDGGDLITLDGNFATRMIDVKYLTTLTVQRMKFVRGRAAQSGGAIDASEPPGVLSIINCTFDDCQTIEGGPDRGGGAIHGIESQHTRISGCTFNKCAGSNGGAVNSLGSRLTIIDCTFTQNAAFGTGGGLDAGPNGKGGIGGAVYVDNVSNIGGALHQLLISGCLFNANVANHEAGAVFGFMTSGTSSTMIVDATTFCGNVLLSASGGAVYTLNETLTLTNSTFSGNTSGDNGGGLRTDNAAATVTNCTFQGNNAGIGGAISHYSGSLTLQNVTVAENTSSTFAAGIFAAGSSAVTVNNSIFADNTSPDAFNGWHTNRTFTTGSGNVQWPTVTTSGPGRKITTSVTVPGDPKLNALAANGGPTYTMSLAAGSAAINVVAGTVPTNDQRGHARSDGFIDAGGFEN